MTLMEYNQIIRLLILALTFVIVFSPGEEGFSQFSVLEAFTVGVYRAHRCDLLPQICKATEAWYLFITLADYPTV